ncbi:PP1R7 [Hepatospora eriocheir]|uniref:PP1R7 n=1 Tax=Hepatospora eriocheir TaxID=1081669 RepID=A0A1X0QEE6_9MICR|nr:PP1R7 [Hepatospora eriocheir]
MENYQEDEIYFKIRMVSDKLKINPKIKAVDSKKLQLKEIPAAIHENVECLDISDNLIKNVVTDKFKNILILDLGYNLLQNHDDIKNKSLKELYLMANDILSISESIAFHTRLEKFDIAANRITDIKNLSLISKNIKEIYLGANKITDFNIDLSEYENLHTLDLQYNKLKTIDFNLLPINLKQLLINNNKDLVEIKNRENLKSLELFDSSNTKLEHPEKF